MNTDMKPDMKNITVDIVDSTPELSLQCATIQNVYESGSPKPDLKLAPKPTQLAIDLLTEDEVRRIRGTVIDNRTKRVVHPGGFFPYEFTEIDREKFDQKTTELHQNFNDMTVGYSFEGTIIRIFYHNKWYVSTHRKLDANRSKWGSDKSFKILFESGLQDSYGLTLQQLINRLNLRCHYTFMVMADANTRFVCEVGDGKKVYLVGTNDPAPSVNIDPLPVPNVKFETVDCVFNYVKEMTYPFAYQGLLLVHRSGSQYRVINSEYGKLFQVRNNEQSIPFRYLQLKTENASETIDNLKKLFPTYIPIFEQQDVYVDQLADFIHVEYTKRKQNNPIGPIDQHIYLFIKNRLMQHRNVFTKNQIKEILWSEKPSYLNQMIRLIKYQNSKKEQTKLVVEFDKIDLSPKSLSPKSDLTVLNAPKKKKVKYIQIPVSITCRKQLFK